MICNIIMALMPHAEELKEVGGHESKYLMASGKKLLVCMWLRRPLLSLQSRVGSKNLYFAGPVHPGVHVLKEGSILLITSTNCLEFL